jgi:bifunctional enzyme CysN/CysC
MHAPISTHLVEEERPKGLLRFLTCGSVDDGKSSLIGRLLHDTESIFDDELSILAKDSVRHGTIGHEIDFALLMDGLEAEREQGITIDVAYRYFHTSRRSFIVADAPGHEQYTRNMATGASNADLAVILIDARKGALVQTRRHSLICSLLGVHHVVLAVNKIDLVDYSVDAFNRIASDYEAFSKQLGFKSIVAIPVSARFGDNVTTSSTRTPWHQGPTLLDYLETIDVEGNIANKSFRFPVQWVNRPNETFRGYAGTVVSGSVNVGDPIIVANSGLSSRIAEIITYDGAKTSASATEAITITLADDLDVARGDILVGPTSQPEVSDQFAANLIWMSEDRLVPGRSYLGRFGTKITPLTITRIKYKIDVKNGDHLAADPLGLNDIAFCNFSTDTPVAFDPYQQNRRTGCFIIIDRFNNHTVGAGMIAFGLRYGTNIHWQPSLIGTSERASLKRQQPAIVWFTGLPGAGKSTVANIVEQRLHARGHHTMLLDGDNVRHGLNRDLGFTETDRVENIRRAGEVAKLMTESGLIVLCSFISPYRAERDTVRALMNVGEFIEVFVDTPIEECIRRDPKGLYARAKAGAIKNLTGLDAPYEAPQFPEVHLHTVDEHPEGLAEKIVSFLAERGLLGPPR